MTNLATSHARRSRRSGVPIAMAALLALVLMPAGARAQEQPVARTNTADSGDLTNPIAVLQSAAKALRLEPDDAGEAVPEEGLSASLSIVILLTVISLAPSLLVMCTSFTRIIVVLALLRQAMGMQSLPPTQVIVGLSLFLTIMIMAPTFDRINQDALIPLQNNEINQFQAWEAAKKPLRKFMFEQIEHADNWADVYMILNYRGIDTSEPQNLKYSDVDMITLIPAFMLSELKVAFLIGFGLYLPFLIIDMVIASILISMGMLMLPPVLISLPFKLLMFVLVDGWLLVVGNLLNSFAVGPAGIPGVGG
jgi:flagellar biosynthetic protein FliP